LSPESASYPPPRDILGAVWSQGRGSLSGGKRRKTRCIGEADVRRTPRKMVQSVMQSKLPGILPGFQLPLDSLFERPAASVISQDTV
jgi:hypothetical protein